ncbi:conserved protein, unknown function [Hepatocystis sp. ex Piliocolobus tephrosceles]|nr:conserved protein, unknown function [Hepatocystis sp. ex Piliocolobus tephrosceles]
MSKLIRNIKCGTSWTGIKNSFDNIKTVNSLFLFSQRKYNKVFFSSVTVEAETTDSSKSYTNNSESSISFLDSQELKLVNNRKITFISRFKDRINVFLKPLQNSYDIYNKLDCKIIKTNENNNHHEHTYDTMFNSNKAESTCNNINKTDGDKFTSIGTYKHNERPIDEEDERKESVNGGIGDKNDPSSVKFCSKYLQADRFNAIQNENHKYIYDFEVQHIKELSKYEPGTPVNIYFDNKDAIGIGLLNRKSNIIIRIIERNIFKTIDDTFFIKKLYESIKRRFSYIYNINLYKYIYSFHAKNNITFYCNFVNSINDELDGLNVYVFSKTLYIRYDNLAIQKYNYIFENELEKIFTPKNIYCKKIISKKEKRAQKGKEYVLEHIKGNDLDVTYSTNNVTFYNNITNISYNIFNIINKQDIIFLKSIINGINVLNINENVGEYTIITSLTNKNIPNIKESSSDNHVTIILSDSVKNASYVEKNISVNDCKNVTSLYREDIQEELNNMYLNSLRFGLVIFNIKNNIVYRKNSYTSIFGKRHVITFKGIHKYLSIISELVEKDGFLFITVELSAVEYDKFLNIVKCVFEQKKKNIFIIYENSCSIENNVLCSDKTARYVTSVCFKLGPC